MTQLLSSSQTAAMDTEQLEIEPIPPRYWWLRRILICAGAVALLLVGLPFWWGWEANRRLQAEIDKYVAAGEPIYPEDFDQEPVPDDQNAAKFLKDAAAAMNLTAYDTKLIDEVRDDFGAAQENLSGLQTLVEANTEVLRLVRRARSAPGVDWGLPIRSPALSFPMANLSGQRMLAKFLVAATGYYSEVGDHAESVAVIRDVFAVETALDHQPLYVSHLVAASIGALAVQSLELLTPGLTIESGGQNDADQTEMAVRDEIGSLIRGLLDDVDYQRAMVRTIQSERMRQLYAVQLLIRGDATVNTLLGFPAATGQEVFEKICVYAMRPLLALDGVDTLRRLTAYADLIRRAEYTPAVTGGRLLYGGRSLRHRILHPVSTFYAPSLERGGLFHFRQLAMRRMAAAALAIRLYELDHGRRPDALGDLVPEYLPAVPLDPFGSGAATISYLPNAASPILYSIGKDGVDSEELDLPFFLYGDPPGP